MKTYKAVIFDHIDTLTESYGMSEATAKLEAQLGEGAVKRLIDNGAIDVMPSPDAIVEKFKSSQSLPAEEEQSLRQWIEWTRVGLYDDTIPTLSYLKEKGYLIGLISNSPPTSRDPLADLGLRKYINYSIFSFEAKLRKPEAGIFLALLKKMSIAPAEALMIGDDMKNDILGAEAVGMDAILLDRTNTSDYQPKISSLKDLIHIL